MAIRLFEKLSNDCLELLDDKEDYNVIINLSEFLQTKTFYAHSAILRHRSLYFRNKLANTYNDKNNIKVINLKNASIQQFEIFIKYIYGGIVLLEDYDEQFIFDLMLLAHEFLLEELAKLLENHLIKEKDDWLRLHFALVYQKSFHSNKLQELQIWCNDILAKSPSKVFESEDFTTLQENALVSLIKRDDLQMEEGRIWNCIIKWGIAQNSELPFDYKYWSYENFLTLKNILRNCLPHIRYFQICGEDIFDNVQPYKLILDETLWHDITKKFIVPDRPLSTTVLPPRKIVASTKEPFSAIINETHAAEIASWIDKNIPNYSEKDNPYEFRLLLRGSRDGFSAESFWKVSDGQANTVIVMKVKGTDEILGGYNPTTWDRPNINAYRFNYCNESFIFSLKNGNIQNSVISHVVNPEKAIYCQYNYGPGFGGGRDLGMKNNFNQDNKCYCNHHSYEMPIRNIYSYDGGDYSSFSVEEYEIFQVLDQQVPNGI